jgi:MFS family permease
MNFSPIGGRVRLTRVLQAELIILGTLIGSYINSTKGWRWIFWLSLIIGFALVIPYILYVPETRVGAILSRRSRKLRR